MYIYDIMAHRHFRTIERVSDLMKTKENPSTMHVRSS